MKASMRQLLLLVLAASPAFAAPVVHIDMEPETLTPDTSVRGMAYWDTLRVNILFESSDMAVGTEVTVNFDPADFAYVPGSLTANDPDFGHKHLLSGSGLSVQALASEGDASLGRVRLDAVLFGSGKAATAKGLAASLRLVSKLSPRDSGVITVSGAAIATPDFKKVSATTINAGVYHEPPPYHVLVLASGGGGSVSQNGTGPLIEGAARAITATPNACHNFSHWSVVSGEGAQIVDSSNVVTSVTLGAGDASIEAVFTRKQFQLTLQSLGQGTVGPTPQSIVACGDTITVTAEPAPGYLFLGWVIAAGQGELLDPGGRQPRVILDKGDLTLEAQFDAATIIARDGSHNSLGMGSASTADHPSGYSWSRQGRDILGRDRALQN